MPDYFYGLPFKATVILKFKLSCSRFNPFPRRNQNKYSETINIKLINLRNNKYRALNCPTSTNVILIRLLLFCSCFNCIMQSNCNHYSFSGLIDLTEAVVRQTSYLLDAKLLH